jgi:hypothetical protein
MLVQRQLAWSGELLADDLILTEEKHMSMTDFVAFWMVARCSYYLMIPGVQAFFTLVGV